MNDCACVSRDARECIRRRYGDQWEDDMEYATAEQEECECCCHDEEEEE